MQEKLISTSIFSLMNSLLKVLNCPTSTTSPRTSRPRRTGSTSLRTIEVHWRTFRLRRTSRSAIPNDSKDLIKAGLWNWRAVSISCRAEWRIRATTGASRKSTNSKKRKRKTRNLPTNFSSLNSSLKCIKSPVQSRISNLGNLKTRRSAGNSR